MPGTFYQWYDAQTGLAISNPISPLCFESNDVSGFSAGSNPVYAVAIVDGCASVPSVPVNLIFESYPDEEAMVMDDFITCDSNALFINANTPVSSFGFWTSPDLNITIENSMSPSTSVSNLSLGENILVWNLEAENSCGIFDRDTLRIFIDGGPEAINDVLTVNPGSTSQLNIFDNDMILGDFITTLMYFSEPPFKGTITQQGNVLTYKAADHFIGTEIFSYQICSEACPEIMQYCHRRDPGRRFRILYCANHY